MAGHMKSPGCGCVYMIMPWPQSPELADGHALVGKSFGARTGRLAALGNGCHWVTQGRAAKGAIFVLKKKRYVLHKRAPR